MCLIVLFLVLAVSPLCAQPDSGRVMEIGVLPAALNGTSGLVYGWGSLWTVNDHSALSIYKLDSVSGAVTECVGISDVMPVDLEEMQVGSNCLYLGDIGNNCGCRNDLRILRIDSSNLFSAIPVMDTIAFFYPEQMLFSADPFSSDFDCEAFVVVDDSVFLFTKQWSSLGTSCYVIPNVPGVHVAELRYTLPVQGLVTGASLIVSDGDLLLVGYSRLLRPFLLRLSDWREPEKVRFDKFFLSERMAQVEAVAQSPNGVVYVTNEAFGLSFLLRISPRLLRVL